MRLGISASSDLHRLRCSESNGWGKGSLAAPVPGILGCRRALRPMYRHCVQFSRRRQSWPTASPRIPRPLQDQAAKVW